MVLDVAWIAEDLNPGGSGIFGGVHYAALAQVLIVSLGSVPRFLLNDLRRDKDGNPQHCLNIFLGVTCYLVALGVWVAASIDLHLRVGDPAVGPGSAYKYALLAVIWGQVGYPVAAFVQWVWINRFATDLDKWAGKPNAKNHMPPDQYSPLLSVTKDVTYAVLDVLSKGGLALLCLVRAAEYDPLAVGVKLTVG